MPETAVNRDRLLKLAKYEIRFARKMLYVLRISEAQFTDYLPDCNFYARPFGPDGPHVCAAPQHGDVVHDSLLKQRRGLVALAMGSLTASFFP